MIKISNIFAGLLSTIRLFPLTALYCLLWFGLTVYITRTSGNHDSLIPILHSLTFGIFLSAFIHSFVNFQFTKRLIQGTFLFLSIITPIAYYFYLDYPFNYGQEEKMIFQTALLCISSFVGLFWAPFLPKLKTKKEFWDYSHQVSIGAIFTVIFGVMIFFGSLLILFALDQLFGFDIEKISFNTFLLIIGVFGPLFCLHRITNINKKKEKPTKLYTIFTQYILVPLTLILGAIIYAYLIKIAITQTLPANVLGWLVASFLAISFIAYLALTPFITKQSNLHRRIFWILLLIPNLILFYSLWIRVSEYGLTVPRYTLAVLGLWTLLSIFSFLIKPNHRTAIHLMIFSVLIPFTQIGPLSADIQTLKSQQRALSKLLEDTQPSPQEISAKINFLSQQYPSTGLSPWISINPNESAYVQTQQSREAMGKYVQKTHQISFEGIKPDPLALDYWSWSLFPASFEVPIDQPYSKIIKFETFSSEFNSVPFDSRTGTLSYQDQTIDLLPFLTQFKDAYSETQTKEAPIFQSEKTMIIFEEIYKNSDNWQIKAILLVK